MLFKGSLLLLTLLFWLSFLNGCGRALDDLPWLTPDNALKSSPPIVFVYLVSSECKESLPEYMKSTINQAIRIHSNCSQVILISNFKQCRRARDSVHGILADRKKRAAEEGCCNQTFYIADSESIASQQTKEYMNASSDLFHGLVVNNHLWRSSALRFFLLLDLMHNFSYESLLHVEADNMLYTPLSKGLVEALQRDFPLAATPLIPGQFVTASVLWTSATTHLQLLTSFFLDLAYQRGEHWKGFLQFMWQRFCCRKGGLFPNGTNDGIKPYAMNEMSMLAYYHIVYPSHLRLLPVLPLLTTTPAEAKALTSFSLAGSGVMTFPRSDEVVNMVWDSGSWGQYLGGTWRERGKNVGFTDPSHVIGKAISGLDCRPKMVCTDGNSIFDDDVIAWNVSYDGSKGVCHTIPVVQCPHKSQGNAQSISPLFNLHVHSKRADIFISRHCLCILGGSNVLPATIRLPPPIPMIPYHSLSLDSESLSRLLLLCVVALTLLCLCWSNVCRGQVNSFR